MKIVLDTNCLLQVIFPKAYHKEVWDAFLKRKYTLCYTNEMLLEYREIIARRFGDAQFAEDVVELLLMMPNTERISPSYHFNLITSDPDDNKFVDCAFATNATFIVSNDKHYDVLKDIDFPKIQVLKLKEFLELLQAEGK